MVNKIFIKNKKGISPLIATVLLISFAVSLGAVVMNWSAKVQETAQTSNLNCDNTFIDISVLSSGKPDICISQNKVLMTIEAMSGKITDLKIVLNGEKNVLSKNKILENPIKDGDLARVNLDYNKEKYGKIKEIKIYPIIGKAENEKTCVENFITLANITTCK